MTTETATGTEGISVPSDKATFYRPELDILRFLAFLGIYLSHSLPLNSNVYLHYHLSPWAGELMATIASSGRFGMTLFFLLSGYLITSLLLRERWIKGQVNVRTFYIRRMLRIWPLYFFVLFVAVVYPWGGRLPVPYFVGYILLVGNWITAMWGLPASWASILWSVSLVQQFYLFWPLAVKHLSRSGRLYVTLGLVAAASVMRVYLAVGSLPPYAVFPNTIAEFDSIGTGIFCALALKASVPLLPMGKRLLLAYCGVALLIGCGYWGKVESPTFVIAGHPVAVAGCLALFLAFCGAPFTWRPLVYLGKISYGLYVYHVLALRLVGAALGGRAGTPARFLTYWGGSLLLTIGLASASYRWLEAPFLRRKEKFATMKSRPV